MKSETLTFLENEFALNEIALVRQHRPYKIPRGYTQWNRLSAAVGAGLAMYRDESTARQTIDQATYLVNNRLALWFLQAAPIYALKTELFQSFDRTDISVDKGLLADLQPPIPTFILLFPCNSLISPDKSPLDWVVVHLTSRDNMEASHGEGFGYVLPDLQAEDNAPFNLHWGGYDASDTTWFGGSGIDESGAILQPKRSLGRTAMNEADRLFTDRVRSIVIQVMLTLTYRPDLMEQPVGAARAHTNRRPAKASTVLSPRWLSTPSVVERRTAVKGIGHHASPTTHWRRGHWRRTVVGPRNSTQRKWVWIKPTLVGQ
jgi:hypothetical protein